MFLAVGNWYLHVTNEEGRWGPSNDMEGEILLLEHTPVDNGGRFLLGIRREVSVTDETGAKLTTLLPDAEPWNLGVLSPEWLILTGTSRQMLSVLRWTPERARDGAMSLKAMRKEADEWRKALSEWDGRIGDK